MPANPYLEDNNSKLAMLLMSLGSGMGQAGAAGRPFYEGFAPAAGMFGNALAQSQQMGMQRQQQEEVADLRKRQFALQESEFGFKRQEREDANKRRAGMSDSVLQALGVPGMGVPPTQPTMGPGTFDARLTGLEGGARNGGFVHNELGSGAFGPYQFMPNTWADVRAKNPDLNLPADMTQANREQHDAAHQRFKSGNTQALQTAGFEPTPENLYLAHRFGAGGAQTFLKADPNARLADVLPADWQRQNPDMRGQTVGGFKRLAGERMQGVAGGPQIAQGDAGPAGGGGMQDIDPQIKAAIAAIAPNDPEKAAAMLVQARSALAKTGAKTDAWYALGPDDVKMYPGLDPSKAYQRNRVTNEVKPIGGSLVNIDQKVETEFSKEMGKNDAKRLGEIQENTSRVADVASKVRMATDLLKQTYTGPGGETANAFFKTLGALGVDSAKDKADAATAATSIINELMPRMRAPGSGATSDMEMRVFASALPGMLNAPGGNDRIAAYWDRIGDRALKVQEIAERYATENKRLTGTEFAKEVKALGPLFSADEIKEMQAAGKTKAEPAAPDTKAIREKYGLISAPVDSTQPPAQPDLRGKYGLR